MRFDREAFAANLRAERNRHDLTQADLANRSGVSADTIQKYESASQVPGADKAFALSEALGVDPNRLLGWRS